MLAGVEPQQDDSFQLQLETSKELRHGTVNGFDGSDKPVNSISPQVIDSASTSIGGQRKLVSRVATQFVVHNFW
jgi:hypothetical protein